MIRMVAGDFERSVTFAPAYDCRVNCEHETKGNHGVHCVDLRFVLRGPAGATSFALFTGWELRHGMPDGWEAGGDSVLRASDARRDVRSLMPVDLGFHAYEPQYPGQESWGECNVLDAPGFCDGSSLNAEAPFWRLLKEGDEGVWDELLSYYKQTFDAKVEA